VAPPDQGAGPRRREARIRLALQLLHVELLKLVLTTPEATQSSRVL
jgi:hypothetical protein